MGSGKSRGNTVQHGTPVWVWAAVTLGSAAIGAGGTFAATFAGGDPPAQITAAARQEVEFLTPANGATVDQVTQPTGKSLGLGPGEVVWIFIKPPGSDRLHPASYPCQSTGDTWQCPKVVAGDEVAAGTFELIPTVADGRAQRILMDYLQTATATDKWPGLEDLPQGAVEAGARRVVLRR
jgi:hypothetical protein